MTKRDKFADFNKAVAESKNKEAEEEPKNHTKDMLAMMEEAEGKKKSNADKPWVRLYTVPKSKPKATPREKNQVGVVALPMVGNKDSDGLELGAEASTIKDKKDKEETEEEDEEIKVIEIHDCFPYALTKK